MINRDRVLKLIKDFKEWNFDCKQCIQAIDKCEDENIKKMLCHSIRAYFLDFHILCEDFISISLKELNKFKIDISAIEGMKVINESNKISNEFTSFYITSRRLRNRLAHRYKMPSDDELLDNLKNNLEVILEIQERTKELIA